MDNVKTNHETFLETKVRGSQGLFCYWGCIVTSKPGYNLSILCTKRGGGWGVPHIPQFLRTPRCNALGRLNGMRVQRKSRERKTTKCKWIDEGIGSSVEKRMESFLIEFLSLQNTCSVCKTFLTLPLWRARGLVKCIGPWNPIQANRISWDPAEDIWQMS